MSRVWLIGLLLVNGLFYALIRWGAQLEESETLLAQKEFNAEKIRLLDAADLRARVQPVPASVPEAAGAERASQVAAALPASRLSPELASPPPVARCLTWGEFSGESLKLANNALAALQLGDKLQRRTVEYDSGYWVYMPPQKNTDQAKRKVEQLQRLGVKDYFVVQEKGEWLHAISLGVFRTEQAANNYLEVLKTKGVRTAKVGERRSKLKFTVFELKGIDGATAEKLNPIQHDFPDSELKTANCN